MRTDELKVVFLIGSADFGGAEGQTVRLAQELRTRGWSPEVWFTRDAGPLTKHLDESDIAWRVFQIRPRDHPFRTLWVYVQMAWAFHTTRPAVAHAQLTESILVGLSACFLGSPRTKRVAGVRGFTPWRGSVMETALKWTFRRTDLVVCNAQHLKADVTERFSVSPNSVLVIPNGVDLPAIACSPGAEPPVGVVIANFHPYKGHLTLVEALSLLDSPPVIRLCGTGEMEPAVRERVHALGLTDVIQFVPFPADVPRELLRAQFAVHPSETEGLCNAILEEISSGLPVIACDVGGNSTLVIDGHNGALVPSRDAASLARAITQLSGDPKLRRRWGERGREHARKFSWDVCASQFAHAYQQLLVDGRRHSKINES